MEKYSTKINCPHCKEEIFLSVSDEKLKEGMESEAMVLQRKGLVQRMAKMRRKLAAYRKKYGELPDQKTDQDEQDFLHQSEGES